MTIHSGLAWGMALAAAVVAAGWCGRQAWRALVAAGESTTEVAVKLGVVAVFVVVWAALGYVALSGDDTEPDGPEDEPPADLIFIPMP